MNFKKLFSSLFVVLSLLSQLAMSDQFIPIPSYRIGPYAAGGSGFFGGMIDYFNLINERDSGINGVKISWEECETEYRTEKALACYERLKNKGEKGASLFQFASTGATYALLEKSRADKIPLLSMGYGRTDSADGRVFPYVFPLITTYWSQNTAKIKFIGQQEGGMDKLKGKVIVNLHHGSGYGRETIPVLDRQAQIYGFKVIHVEVSPPGINQQSQWLNVLRVQPDWVILRGWGVMSAVALKMAEKMGFPRERMVGVWWSGAEEDVIPAGKAAIGYIAAGFHPSGTGFPVHDDLKRYVYDRGLGNMQDISRVGSIYHNRGLITAMISVEGIRRAQQKYGPRVLSGEEIRWGFENLKLEPQAITQLGFYGLAQPLSVSCTDHEGGGAVKFSQWDGEQWLQLTDWIESDQSIVRPMIESSAARYAELNEIPLRECE
ncbi:ABC transporter substrate-binding protein [Motiliproteus sp. MSK22-1]|uniref:ABC transporter substrate-binding protein n=1 Tax=Motiliproteus sp. MSK22-1 TaxID=1897630 RepID=UPI00097862E7|nr:ABC transporter substrate-binding protein [Motiliproteus sp. MSK22-1]OMH38304.1 ABC transporter permease [Motiliproteus sp. MSK22-1]